MDQDLFPSLFSDGDSFFAASVVPGSATISPTPFFDLDTFYAPKVRLIPNLWPFVPLMNISETLEHLSNVLITRTTEQRLQLRHEPRQTFTYVNQLDNHEFAKAKMFAQINAATSVYAPVWLEAVRLGGVGALEEELFFDTSYGDWRAEHDVLIWQSYDNYKIMQVQEVTPSSIVLTSSASVDFSQPFVIPLRECATKQGYQFERTTLWARVTCVFSVLDNAQLIEDDATSLPGYSVYQNLIVVPAPPYEAAQVAESILRPTVYFDNGFGLQIGEATRTVNDAGQIMTFLDNLGPELWSRRLFLHWIRGKQVPFWYPTYNKDLDLVNPITSADTFITVRSITPNTPHYVGKHIMILLKNGTKYFRQITAASVQIDGDRLNITAIGENISLAAINLVCFLTKVRSNTDSFTFSMATPNMVAMTMPVLEVTE